MTSLVGTGGYILAGLLYSALAAWQWRASRGSGSGLTLAAALAATAAWAASQAILGSGTVLAGVTEAGRTLGWLLFMFVMIRSAEATAPQRAVRLVYLAVAGVAGLQILLALLRPEFGGDPASALATSTNSLGILAAAGSLVLVHNLYGQASSASRAELQLPVIALVALWAYDLHLYTQAYLTGRTEGTLFELRGAIAAALVPFFILATRSGAKWRVQLSRSATFQSLSIIAILIYFVVMMALTPAGAPPGAPGATLMQLGFMAVMSVLGAALLFSSKSRAWLRVMISKHFFEHRYDYRADWLRFTRAVSQPGDVERSLGERVVQALADIAGSPGGLMLIAEEGGMMKPAASWNWPDEEPSGRAGEDLIGMLESGRYVIDFPALTDGFLVRRDERARVPDWLRTCDAWAGIPLVHNDKLAGLVLLDHPSPRRSMDWEDYDLFRTAGIQAASYIAEARSQDALANARRFDEFNRRFAFIMHDIKNLVSQLSLVARNAERHAENPEFRADMIATLQSSVKKMNDLLMRLSSGPPSEGQELQTVLLHPLLARIADARRFSHPVEIDGDARLAARADAVRLEQALVHLLQNAIDATKGGAPVRISYAVQGDEVAIEIADKGCGMSSEFIQTRLFQPFASTKQDGFGIGAFEARTLVEGMGGTLGVASRPGHGSRFTITLAAAEAGAASDQQRISA